MTLTSADFDGLYRAHAPGAFRRARRILGSEADAHELVHDVFLSLFERPEQWQGQSALTTFMYSAVTHACLNRLRNGRNRLRLLEQHTFSEHERQDPSAEQLAMARALLSRMPEPLAQVAVHRYMDELTHDDIARILGCSRRHVGDLIERLERWTAQEEVA